MAFRKKANIILQHLPDILVIPECEHPDKINFAAHTQQPTGISWFGDNTNKGVGIFCYNGFTCNIHKAHNPVLKYIAPVSIKNGSSHFILYAVWANNPQNKDGAYVTQIWKALAHYKRLIRKSNTILTGDFNSNTIWDKPRRNGNHTHVVQALAKKGIESTYHKYFNQQQGEEAHPTWYLHRNAKKPYHLDYCFVAENMLQQLQSVEVGNAAFWLQHSDHMPVISRFC